MMSGSLKKHLRPLPFTKLRQLSTNTNITFPTGYGIAVNAGVPVYVHLDVRNESLIDIQVDQDAWIYYVPLP
jgi:hypothetical protein